MSDQGPPDDRSTYTVGYGRPPEHGKIKPGEIRNKRGKARGTRSMASEIREMLAIPVSFTENGKVKRTTTRMAGLLKLREKALKGDPRALERLLALAIEHDVSDGQTATTSGLMAEDARILENARERERQALLGQMQPPSLPSNPETAEVAS